MMRMVVFSLNVNIKTIKYMENLLKLIFTVFMFLLVGCSQEPLVLSDSYMNGKSNLVDIYITKRDLLEIVKEKYRDQFEELSSITKDDNEKYVFQFQVDSYVLNFPKDFVLSEKNLTLYMFFYDCLPELLKQHKAR